ncbi:C-type lectin protein [Aphelenchoides avenae]|nr:C-type lectin protein [Aphelenchus avenae]
MHCQSRAPTASLASVHDAKELHFVTNLAMKTGEDWAWIGLTQIGLLDKNAWQWVDLSPVDYTNWLPRQPDGTGGNQHCVRLRLDEGARWDDMGCDVPYPLSICQVRPS